MVSGVTSRLKLLALVLSFRPSFPVAVGALCLVGLKGTRLPPKKTRERKDTTQPTGPCREVAGLPSFSSWAQGLFRWKVQSMAGFPSWTLKRPRGQPAEILVRRTCSPKRGRPLVRNPKLTLCSGDFSYLVWSKRLNSVGPRKSARICVFLTSRGFAKQSTRTQIESKPPKLCECPGAHGVSLLFPVFLFGWFPSIKSTAPNCPAASLAGLRQRARSPESTNRGTIGGILCNLWGYSNQKRALQKVDHLCTCMFSFLSFFLSLFLSLFHSFYLSIYFFPGPNSDWVTPIPHQRPPMESG